MWLAESPQVDAAVVAASDDESATRAADVNAIHIAAVRHQLLKAVHATSLASPVHGLAFTQSSCCRLDPADALLARGGCIDGRS
jgi:hypothetical protein